MSLEFVLSDIPFRLVQMKALLAACKPLILLDFHRSFNDTRTRKSPETARVSGLFLFVPALICPLFSNTFLTSLEEASGAFFRRALLPGRVQVPVNVSRPLNIDWPIHS